MSHRLHRLLASILAFIIMLALIPPARTAGAAAPELFFSEYIEGSSFNKSVEIFNGTLAPVNLAGYVLELYANGAASPTQSMSLGSLGPLAPGDVLVISHPTADPAILGVTDATSALVINFNGDDAVVLRHDGVLVDVIGQIGFDPGTEWGSGFASTADNTVRRLASVCQGDTNGSDAFVPATEWEGFALNAFDGLGAHSASCGDDDLPPFVTATGPVNSATGVPLDANVDISFSEPVLLSGEWISFACASSGPHSFVLEGGPQEYHLHPDADFTYFETCTVTLFAAGVLDQDGTAQPMAADFVFSFTTIPPPFGVCGEPATYIHTIQGSGPSSPLNGASNVVVEAIVVGDYQGPGQFNGFHLQEQDSDADAEPTTSEGIWVFNTTFPVNAGDLVRLRGSVVEFSTSGALLTELLSITDLTVCSSGNSVTPTEVTLPITNLGDWERYEGMLIHIPQELTVTETFTLARFGEVALSVNGRLFNPTTTWAPGEPALAQQSLNDRSRILLDDANNQQNIDPTLYPSGGLSAANTLRSGYTVDGLTGVLEHRFGVYRVQPVAGISFEAANPRPATPETVPGRLRIAAMNVLNYFTTLDAPGSGPFICGPLANLECRGATSATEFARQRAKIISAILGLDAHVIGLMEIENNASASLQDLVDGLNASTVPGTYAYIDTGTIGNDAIKVAIIYRPEAVTPVGAHAVLDSVVDPAFIDTLNRPVLAQTFAENVSGETFTVVVNHLKSKGSDCNAVGDPDAGDGQGNCNQTRTTAAIAEANWLAGDPTGSGDPDFILLGDFNAYFREDPIQALLNAGYSNVIHDYLGEEAYSFVFQGQSGYLDHALTSPTLSAQVTGAVEWHVNADEPVALDYNVEFKSPGQVNTFYSAEPFRSSDHDPLIVGLDLIPQCHGQNATVYVNTAGFMVGGQFNDEPHHGVVMGGPGNDVIAGTTEGNMIVASGGNDLICGMEGNDTIQAGFGRDIIDGGEGDDTCNGGPGTDQSLACEITILVP